MWIAAHIFWWEMFEFCILSKLRTAGDIYKITVLLGLHFLYNLLISFSLMSVYLIFPYVCFVRQIQPYLSAEVFVSADCVCNSHACLAVWSEIGQVHAGWSTNKWEQTCVRRASLYCNIHCTAARFHFLFSPLHSSIFYRELNFKTLRMSVNHKYWLPRCLVYTLSNAFVLKD